MGSPTPKAEMSTAAPRIGADLELMLYLDHAATTPMRPEVSEAMAPYLGDRFGNPSGIHAKARRAKNSIEEARERIALSIGAANPLEIVFTGGGTEADNLAVIGAAMGGQGGVVTTAVEHPAVLESVRFLSRVGFEVTVGPVDRDGRVAPEEIANAIAGDTAVVSVMTANNETGVIQPVIEIARSVRSASDRTLIHTDAVQAFGSLPVTATNDGPDLISVSGHKIGGPQGVGFLADVTAAWEAAATPAAAAGIRVVYPRTGVVLSTDGGALQRLLLPFKLGAGGRTGPGNQWWSLIALQSLTSRP